MRNNDMLTAAEIRMLLKEEPNTDQKHATENTGDNNPEIDEEEEEDDFDADAFRKQCEEVLPRFMTFQASDVELPVTDSIEKLKVLCDVLDQYDGKGRKQYAPEPVTIPMEERISRAKKRANS